MVEEHNNTRLDHFASDRLELSRSQCQKLIKEGKIGIEGQKSRPKDPVKAGDRVWYDRDSHVQGFQAKPLDFKIVYEDKDLIVVNKDPGIVVHPGAGNTGTTLIEGVAHYLQKEGVALPGDELRPGIVHRLDKDTSGVMVIAKNSKAMNSLADQFKDKSNLREYVALVDGKLSEDVLDVESYLFRDPRHRTRYSSITVNDFEAIEEQKKHSYRYAKSTFFRRRTYVNRISLVQVRLSTGRTHQIRVHAKSLNMPILGDDTYGHKPQFPSDFPQVVKKAVSKIPRQMLHAKKLGFVHPTTGEKLGFEVPLADDFKSVLDELEPHVE